MPLLAEELLDLTVEELINDFGAELECVEHWWGFEYVLKAQGHALYSSPSDYPLNPEDFDIV